MVSKSTDANQTWNRLGCMWRMPLHARMSLHWMPFMALAGWVFGGFVDSAALGRQLFVIAGIRNPAVNSVD